jgi:hypothetical protein
MFVVKARSLPESRVPKKGLTLVSSSFTRKHCDMLEKSVKEELSSLLWKLINFDRKMFYNIGPRSPQQNPMSIYDFAIGQPHNPGDNGIKYFFSFTDKNKLECLPPELVL